MSGLFACLVDGPADRLDHITVSYLGEGTGTHDVVIVLGIFAFIAVTIVACTVAYQFGRRNAG